jgi:hypothetical protein
MWKSQIKNGSQKQISDNPAEESKYIAKTGNETLTVDVKETEAQTSCLFCMDDFSNFEGGGEWLRWNRYQILAPECTLVRIHLSQP